MPASASLVGGRYRLDAHLGKGGMGVVYRAVDPSDGSEVALKVLKCAADDPDRASRLLGFRREFHTLAELRHPRIVEAYEFGVDEQRAFYTMEMLDGRDLRDAADLGWKQICALARDVAAALAFLHSRRLVHRDVSPRNVRCTSDGRAKLIDFGVLATVGTCDSAAGTPPYLAPETLRGTPLDARTDLYGLGALLYWLVTGQHAFPARKFSELPKLWTRRPLPPSELAEDVPAALDDLILSLLSTDRLGRPRAAAEVIDRLGAIAELEPAPELETAQGYLATGAFVGRDRVMKRLKRWLRDATRGAGRCVTVGAATGIGKTRLLREVALAAQLRGATLVNVACESVSRGAYGVVMAVAKRLLTTNRDSAVRAARPHARLLARLLPELRDELGVTPRRVGRDANEERMRLQAALHDWFLAIADERPMALLVDDIQRCDEASAAVLASLARDASAHSLLVVVAQRSDEEVRAAAAVAGIRDASTTVRLRGLDADDVHLLVTATFGAIAHTTQLAHWLHRVAGGTPLYCTELLRHLVDQGTVRCIDGMWVLPEDFGAVAPPKNLARAMDSRVALLSPEALALAQVLSVHGGSLPLELCVQLAGVDEQAAFAALDELQLNEILIGSVYAFTFRHDGVREAVLRTLDDETTRSLHLRVGQSLTSVVDAGPERAAEVGWHLLRGGEELRGGRLLADAGRRLYAAQSFADAIEALEAALDVYRRHSLSPRAQLEMVHMLIVAASVADHAVIRRYSRDAIAELRVYSGVDRATGLSRYLGRRLALIVGMAIAGWHWLWASRETCGPDPVTALQWLFINSTVAASIYAQSLELDRFRELVDGLEPAAVFRSRIPYAIYLLAQSLLLLLLADFEMIDDNLDKTLRILKSDKLSPIGELELQNLESAAWYMRALMAVSAQDPSYTDKLAHSQRHELRFYELNACQAHVAYHRSRGEEERAAPWEAQAEMLAIRLGSVQQMRAWLTVVSSLAYGFSRDVLALKRCIETLWHLKADGYHYSPPLELARGEYHRERGELDEAKKALVKCIEVTPEELNLIRQPALTALAETHLALNELKEARAIATRAVELATDERFGMIANALRAMRVLALVEASAGELDEAAARLDSAIELAAETRSPVLLGALHEARARVALAADDSAANIWHATQAMQLFQDSRNPALIAQGQRLEAARELAEDDRERGRVVGEDAVTASTARAVQYGTELLSDCRGPAERAERGLRMLLESTSGSHGYLFLLQGERLKLVAPTSGRAPAGWLTAAVEGAFALARRDDVPSSQSKSKSTDRLTQRIIVLSFEHDKDVAYVGAAVVLGGAVPLMDADARLVERLAHELFDAGDVTLSPAEAAYATEQV